MAKRENIEIEDGIDAVFLPGKLHGCDHQVYIIYFNDQADEGNGCWEIEIVDRERIVEIYEKSGGNPAAFFGIMPDYFHGEWYYCNKRDHEEEFNAYAEEYPNADFIFGYDGDLYDEMIFLVNWALGKTCQECGSPIKCECVLGADESASRLIERLYSCNKCGSSWYTQEVDGKETIPKRYYFG